MAITDLNFGSIPSSAVEPAPMAVVNNDESNGAVAEQPQRPRSLALPQSSSRQSLALGSSATTTTSSIGQCTLTELNFGFSVDLPASPAVSHMTDIVCREDVRRREFDASDVANTAENLELEGLRQAASLSFGSPSAPPAARGSPSPLSVEPLQENFDTYAGILNFTHKRDAVMAYYYMDENNRLKVTKIFGCESKGVTPFDSHSLNEPSTFAFPTKQWSSATLSLDKNKQPQTVGGAEKAVAVVAPFHQEAEDSSPKRLSTAPSKLGRSFKLKPCDSNAPSTSRTADISDSDAEKPHLPTAVDRRRRRRHTCSIGNWEKAYEAELSSENYRC